MIQWRRFLPILIVFFSLVLPISSEQAQKNNPCPDDVTQAEMNQCSAELHQKADARLNMVYAKALDGIREDLREAVKEHDADQQIYEQTALRKLKAAERAWVQYRNLHCDAERQKYEGGSMSPMIWSDCMTLVTEHRIDELKQAYEEDYRKLE